MISRSNAPRGSAIFRRSAAAVLLVLLVSSTGLLNAAGRKAVALVPSGGKAITLVISGKEKEYYELSPGTPLKLDLDGPGKLTVISRLLIPKGSSAAEHYSIRITDGPKTVKLHSTQTDRSDAAVRGSDDLPAKSRKFTVDVPEGQATYAFKLEETARNAAVRFQFESKRGPGGMVAIEPLSYDRIVTATIKEKLVAYYVSSATRDVRLRVVGPTQVMVSARLNYDDRLKGEQKFSIIVKDAQGVVIQRAFQTTKSTGLSYTEWKTVVPGKPNQFMLTVPSGEHSYRFSLGESLAQSVSLRFSVPKGDLSNEE